MDFIRSKPYLHSGYTCLLWAEHEELLKEKQWGGGRETSYRTSFRLPWAKDPLANVTGSRTSCRWERTPAPGQGGRRHHGLIFVSKASYV